TRLGIEVVDADLQQIVRDERARMQAQRAPQRTAELSPAAVDKAAPQAAKPLTEQGRAGVPDMRAVDAALQAWQAAATEQGRQRAARAWMDSMEQIERRGGDVAAANAHSRRALGDGYGALMRQVQVLALERQRGRGMER
ncbi:MAG: TraI/MobA(P) family conjugative relaxase, partial [Thiomonas sp.]